MTINGVAPMTMERGGSHPQRAEITITSNKTRRRTYNVSEAAKLAGIGINQMYDACRRHEVPSIRIGNRVLIPSAAFDRMLEGKMD